jgi:hypothetical protein
MMLHLRGRELEGRPICIGLLERVGHDRMAAAFVKLFASLSYSRACVKTLDSKDGYLASKREGRQAI